MAFAHVALRVTTYNAAGQRLMDHRLKLGAAIEPAKEGDPWLLGRVVSSWHLSLVLLAQWKLLPCRNWVNNARLAARQVAVWQVAGGMCQVPSENRICECVCVSVSCRWNCSHLACRAPFYWFMRLHTSRIRQVVLLLLLLVFSLWLLRCCTNLTIKCMAYNAMPNTCISVDVSVLACKPISTQFQVQVQAPAQGYLLGIGKQGGP